MKTVVYTVDGNPQAIKWLTVSIASLRKTLGEEVRVVICTDSPRDFGYGTECVDVRGVIAEYGIDRISRLRYHNEPVPPMQIYRLALPVTPALESEDKVVFVDADTEFIDSRWMEIYDEDVEEFDMAGVMDGLDNGFIEGRHSSFVSNPTVMGKIQETVLKRMIDERLYVNGGVLVMNLKRLREEYDYPSMLSGMVDFCVRANLGFLDQDLINLHFKVRKIPSRYNDAPPLHEPGEPSYLRHYAGMEKQHGTYPPMRFQLLKKRKTVDIVYTVGKPSEHDDQELRWSLRSISKYGRNVGRIIVASPVARDWLSKDVIQIDCQDMINAGYKHHNILKSIIETVMQLDLEGEFSVSSDDHFYVKPVDFANQHFVAQHWGIPGMTNGRVSVQTLVWKQSCIDTKTFLAERGMPTIDFQMHRNARWHGGLVKERLDLFNEAQTMRFGCEPHVLMQNLWVHTQPDVSVEFRKDCKIRSFNGIEPWCDCISIYDRAFNDPKFIDFMGKEFGRKCQWER